jgi:hypothetical protein
VIRLISFITSKDSPSIISRLRCMSEQRALFFVRKGVGHALHFARTEVFGGAADMDGNGERWAAAT